MSEQTWEMQGDHMILNFAPGDTETHKLFPKGTQILLVANCGDDIHLRIVPA